MFDRDEPTREKEVYLTVRATDNGKPHLDDVCTIKVTIQDENDNSPVFDKVVSFKIIIIIIVYVYRVFSSVYTDCYFIVSKYIIFIFYTILLC